MTLAFVVACLAVLCGFGAGYALCEYKWWGKPQTCCRDDGGWHIDYDNPPSSRHALELGYDMSEERWKEFEKAHNHR